MRRSLIASVALLTIFSLPTFAADQDLRDKAASAGLEALPSSAPQPENNPITQAKIDLGHKLFFDTRLSASQAISCNTCHNVGTGGADDLPTSVGHDWQKGPRNAPTVFNAVFNKAQFWDGRAKDLKAQAKGPIQAAVEMANKPDRVVATISSMAEYVEDFKKAFPDSQDPITFDNVTKAIEAFEVTLLTPDSAFDRFMKGDDTAMTDKQKAGLSLFIDSGCTACHTGVNIGGQNYFPFGLVKRPGADILPPNDKGRFAVTKSATDEYVFRAASLRNVALTAPYFHSGQVWNLKQAVEVMGAAQLGKEITEDQAETIAAFLDSLTGKQPTIVYPILPRRGEQTPPPEL